MPVFLKMTASIVVAASLMIGAGSAMAQVPEPPVPGMGQPVAESGGLPTPPVPGQITGNSAELMNAAQEAALAAQAEERAAAARQKYIEESYKRATDSMLPMTPDQVRGFMQRLEATQEASIPPFAGTPRGEVKVHTLTLDPGVDPPLVNLAAGYVTTIAVLDATGQPWPILDVGVGGNFEVSPTQAGSHVVRLTPLTRFGNGNLSVLLKDLTTPVIFRLAAGGNTVNLRYDARIPKFGPNAKVPLIDRRKLAAGDEVIMMFLDNAPPGDAKRLRVSGTDKRTMAWMLNDKVFVRTPLTLLSPAWNASVSSADGMTVYEVGDAPVLLASDSGNMQRIRLIREGDDDK